MQVFYVLIFFNFVNFFISHISLRSNQTKSTDMTIDRQSLEFHEHKTTSWILNSDYGQ